MFVMRRAGFFYTPDLRSLDRPAIQDPPRVAGRSLAGVSRLRPHAIREITTHQIPRQLRVHQPRSHRPSVRRRLSRVARRQRPRRRELSAANLRPHLPPSIVAAHAKKGCPLCGHPFFVEVVDQRPSPKVGVTEPTVACCWMWFTQSW